MWVAFFTEHTLCSYGIAKTRHCKASADKKEVEDWLADRIRRHITRFIDGDFDDLDMDLDDLVQLWSTARDTGTDFCGILESS